MAQPTERSTCQVTTPLPPAISTARDQAGDAVLKRVHYIEGAPELLVERVKELGLEGVVAKYAGAPYQGGRTSLWQKLILRRPEKGWRVEKDGRAAWRLR